MSRNKDLWLCAGLASSVELWCIFMALWSGIGLILALMITAGILVARAVAAGAVIHMRRRTAREHQADAQMEYARWAVMTHLSEADQRWLAERHFWVTPVQVARLRAGLDPQPEWNRYYDVPLELRQLREMRSRSEVARAALESIRQTEEFLKSEPVRTCPRTT